MSLDTNIARNGGAQDGLEPSPQEWIARQVAWERRLAVLSRRAEAELEERKKSAAAEDSARPAHQARRPRRKMAA